jgi:translation initiation factor eIF-2B subunit delta
MATLHAGIPVLVAAETCKFHERVQLDAVSNNELGNPDALVDIGGGGGAAGGGGGGDAAGGGGGDVEVGLLHA